MSDVVIRSQNLGKKYTIGHTVTRERYTALRDVLARKMRTTIRQTKDFVHGRAIIKGDELEEVWALRDVSFEIARGEVVGIIGQNGAGKSTLLKILSRITDPSTGRVTIDGRVASLLEVGTGFHPELSGRENIFLNGAILGMSRREIRREFDAIVAFAEVERFLDTPVKRYSSGMYVRLAFAVAAHLNPDILVVDEVLAVGDAAFQKRCLGKMKEVTSAGRTVLFVSHNLGAVSTLCKTAIHLEQGRVKAIGSAEAIVSRYLGELLTPDSNDLSRLRMAGLGEKIRFTDIRLTKDQDGNVPYGMPLTMRLTVAAEVPMQDLSIGMTVFAENGAAVGGTATEDTFAIDAGQELSIELEVGRSNLAPGRYYAGFGVGTGGVSGPRSDFDYVAGIPHFHVVAGASTNYLVANWYSTWGGVIFDQPRLTVCAQEPPASASEAPNTARVPNSRQIA
jgi:lipopolysaccharide transport system ATP-binding protein